MRHVAVIKKNLSGNANHKMIRATQVGKAHQAGISAMGSKYKMGDVILHMSSARATGEVFILTRAEIYKVFTEFGNKYLRTIKPSRAKVAAKKLFTE